jgi:hypothetical protein
VSATITSTLARHHFDGYLEPLDVYAIGPRAWRQVAVFSNHSLLGPAGQALLPDAVTLLSDALERSGGTDLSEEPNTAFELEVLIRKLCYGFGVSIRQRPDWHRAVLRLLDYLVEHGSHTVRLRDDVITPFPAGR